MLRERPVVRTRMLTPAVRRRRRWDAVSWWFSLLFVIPVVLIAATLIVDQLRGPRDAGRRMTLRVSDAFTGQPLAGAEVSTGVEVGRSDGEGVVRLRLPAEPVAITVRHGDYEPVHGQVGPDADPEQAVALRPSTVAGRLIDETTGRPIAGAKVAIESSNGDELQSVTTDADGRYRLNNVPRDARIRIEAGDYGNREERIGDRTTIDLALRVSVVSGTVVDEQGKPIRGATVRAGEARATTRKDGSFRLTGATDAGEVVVAASGYVDGRAPISADRKVSVTLQRQQIKAIYVSAATAASSSEIDRLVKLIDDTELNAVVLDIKEDFVFYDTRVAFFRDAGAVRPIYDPATLLRRFQDRDIYVIARLVVFKDPIVAEVRQDLAVKDEQTGEAWRDMNGVAWVNPTERELWRANIDLALEAVELGFDEIQYDYIRFPSDGDLTRADFGFDYGNEEARVETIVNFLKMSKEELGPTGVKIAADIFGIVAVYGDDQGIGQRLVDVAPYLDYVCPMIYPSHFGAGSIDVGGEPNDYPYETIALSLELAAKQLKGNALKLRPWLQDFSLPGMSRYGADEVRAQIRAAEEAGASGWMIWDPSNQYSEGAFKPED